MSVFAKFWSICYIIFCVYVVQKSAKRSGKGTVAQRVGLYVFKLLLT